MGQFASKTNSSKKVRLTSDRTNAFTPEKKSMAEVYNDNSLEEALNDSELEPSYNKAGSLGSSSDELCNDFQAFAERFVDDCLDYSSSEDSEPVKYSIIQSANNPSRFFVQYQNPSENQLKNTQQAPSEYHQYNK